MRTICKYVLFSFLTIVLSGFQGTQNILKEQDIAKLQRHADSLHKVIISIDTHNDTPICTNHPDRNYGVRKGQVTFPLMKEGGLDAAFFAVFIDQGARDEEGHAKVRQYVIDELNMFRKHVEDNSDVAEIAYSAEDIERIKKAGKRAVILMIENGWAIGRDLKNIQMFYDMGVRIMTLCHNYNNEICDSSQDIIEHGGLSPFGIETIKEMNRVGMIVDVSHAATSTVFDCLQISSKPIMASHSGVWNIKNHPRNLTDSEMTAIAKKGGLVQIASGRFFLSWLPRNEVTVEHLVDHIDYAVKTVGIEHVGLGTDFDGGGGVVGLEDASKMKNITIEMLKRGYTDEEIGLFWGGNVLRMMREVAK